MCVCVCVCVCACTRAVCPGDKARRECAPACAHSLVQMCTHMTHHKMYTMHVHLHVSYCHCDSHTKFKAVGDIYPNTHLRGDRTTYYMYLVHVHCEVDKLVTCSLFCLVLHIPNKRASST